MTTGLFKRIDTVFLPVRDLDKAIAWYTETLGFTVRWKAPNGDYAALNVGETPLTLVQMEQFTQPSHMPFNFYVTNVEAAHQRLQEGGIEVGPIEKAPDVTWFEFTDPDGNKLGVCYFPE